MKQQPFYKKLRERDLCAYSNVNTAREEWSEGEESLVSSNDSDDGWCWKGSRGKALRFSRHEASVSSSVNCSRCVSRTVVSEELRAQWEAAAAQHRRARMDLDQARAAWALQEEQLRSAVRAALGEERLLREALEQSSREMPQPPGPRCLLFVEGGCFTGISSAVIITNVLVVIYETTHPGVSYPWVTSSILTFYVLELVLKAALWQNRFLWGPHETVFWHWLDLVIVLGGLLDSVVMPLFFAHSGTLGMLSLLRGLRLMRLVKLVRNFVASDTSWTGQDSFQIFIMCIIALSSLLMGLECDWPQLTVFLRMIYWETLVLAIFTFEVAVRMKAQGLKFFIHEQDLVWNWLDFIVVAGGVIDQWMLPGIAIVESMISGNAIRYRSSIGKFITILRMLRLLRVLRLVRLVRQVPQLFNLLMGIARAMAGMVWVLVLTIVVLYFFALLAVQLFRDGLAYGSEGAPEDVQDLFNSVPVSIFVLFTVMDGHKSILDPLLDSLPFTKAVFMLFVMISEWAMLSILTAVVSENMILVTESRAKEETLQAETIEEATRDEQLHMLFAKLELNSQGSICLREFDELLEDGHIQQRLCSAANLSLKDLRLLFNVLEHQGQVSLEQFIEAASSESKAVQERSLMKLQKMMSGLEEKLCSSHVTVEGAGIEACNGTYVVKGMHNLKPLYRKPDTGSTLFFDFRWKLSETSDTDSWCYCMGSGANLLAAEWTARDGDAAGNPPLVRWESDRTLEGRMDTLERMMSDLQREVRGLPARLSGRMV